MQHARRLRALPCCLPFVQVEQDGRWWCEGDGCFVDTPEHRYVMTIRLADLTGEAYVMLFNEQVGVGRSKEEVSHAAIRQLHRKQTGGKKPCISPHNLRGLTTKCRVQPSLCVDRGDVTNHCLHTMVCVYVGVHCTRVLGGSGSLLLSHWNRVCLYHSRCPPVQAETLLGCSAGEAAMKQQNDPAAFNR